MANPGVSGSQIPAGEDFAQRQIKDLQRELRELAPSIAKSFAPVIARLEAQDVLMAATIADLATAQGTLATTVSGLSAAVADIAANLASINTLITQVVKPGEISFTASHTLTTTLTSVASTTVTVPAGFTKAVVSGLGTVYMNDPNTTGGQDGLGADYVSSTFTIGGTSVGSSALGLAYGNGGAATSLAVVSEVLTGLTPGGTFVLGIKAKTDYFTITGGWIMVSGTVLWLR